MVRKKRKDRQSFLNNRKKLQFSVNIGKGGCSEFDETKNVDKAHHQDLSSSIQTDHWSFL
jgi:hypothetical protein